MHLKVSIPEGAIEGHKRGITNKDNDKFQYPKVRLKVGLPHSFGLWHQVSIPEGAIEGFKNDSRTVGVALFQYPKVRLKVYLYCSIRTTKKGFNTRRCD